nr:hypothetical protein [Tanacetum cinerariifolium]
MIGCKVMRTLATVDIVIMLILGLPCCLSSSSVRCLESVSKIVTGSDDWLIDVGHACLSVVRVALKIWWMIAGSDVILKYAFIDYVLYEMTSYARSVSNLDPYEAIRQAYLVGTDTESEPFEGEARTPGSPHIVAPPTCHVEESEVFGTTGVRYTSTDSTAPLSPDHTLTHTTPVLVLILRRTARMVVRVSPVMSPGFPIGMEEVEAMFDSTLCKRFRSSYNSSPSTTLPVTKRYRGTSDLILDSDSESKDVEDEGPTVKDEDPTVEDEGLAAGVDGPSVDDESYGLDGESHGVDNESHGLDDESYDIDGEGRGTAMSEPLGLGYGALRHRELALEEDHVYSTFKVEQGSGSTPELERSKNVSAFRQPTLTIWTDLEDDPEDGMVYIDVSVYPPPTPPVQTPPSPEWTSGSLPISPSPFVLPSPVSSPVIPLTIPSPIASPMATSTATISVDEDQFTKIGAQLELYMDLLTVRATGDEVSCDCVGVGEGP